MKTFENGFFEGCLNEFGCLSSGFIFISIIGFICSSYFKMCPPDKYEKKQIEVKEMENSVERNKKRLHKAKTILIKEFDKYLETEDDFPPKKRRNYGK